MRRLYAIVLFLTARRDVQTSGSALGEGNAKCVKPRWDKKVTARMAVLTKIEYLNINHEYKYAMEIGETHLPMI